MVQSEKQLQSASLKKLSKAVSKAQSEKKGQQSLRVALLKKIRIKEVATSLLAEGKRIDALLGTLLTASGTTNQNGDMSLETIRRLKEKNELLYLKVINIQSSIFKTFESGSGTEGVSFWSV
ncbi:uncharacterized protein [Battus philenor]|uniref:uncharacterized protein n=1 Tax=Battus philenor TaxID=42288 RepID=UPI0035D00394